MGQSLQKDKFYKTDNIRHVISYDGHVKVYKARRVMFVTHIDNFDQQNLS